MKSTPIYSNTTQILLFYFEVKIETHKYRPIKELMMYDISGENYHSSIASVLRKKGSLW